MAIPEQFLDELLSRTDLVDLVSESVRLIKKGNSYWGCCPFHSEKTPSFHVVPDRQMSSFIAVAGAYDEQVVYLDSQVVSLREGDRVRITGGVFAGVEGVFLRVKGDRRVVVSIEGVMAVATAFVHPSLIERIP